MAQSSPYPLKLSIASIVMTWLGLAGAAANVRWGAAPKGDALGLSWAYVQVLLTVMWLVVWPALAFGRLGGDGSRTTMIWQMLAILTGALPAAGIAAVLSGVTVPMGAAMMALQLAFAILVLGILTQLANASRSIRLSTMTLLAAITLAVPVVAFLSAEFFPRMAQDWREILPAIATAHAARQTTEWSSYPSHFWMTNVFYGIVGGVLALAGKNGGTTRGMISR